jgi:hypothetical protein
MMAGCEQQSNQIEHIQEQGADERLLTGTRLPSIIVKLERLLTWNYTRVW